MKRIAQTGMFIALFVGLTIGIIAIGAIVTQISGQTSTTTVTNDQFTMSNTSCVDVTTNCILSLTSVSNVTAGTAGINPIDSGNYSICRVNAPAGMFDGVVVSGDASIDVLNGLTLNTTYTGINCDYIGGATTRSLISYIPLLAVVALLVFTIAIGGLGKA